MEEKYRNDTQFKANRDHGTMSVPLSEMSVETIFIVETSCRNSNSPYPIIAYFKENFNNVFVRNRKR